MKILILSYLYWPKISPRAFRWTSVAEYLRAKGHEVEVIAAWFHPFAREETVKGVRIHRVGYAWREEMTRFFERFRTKEAEKGEDPNDALAGLRKGSRLNWFLDKTWRKVYWPDHACVWYPGAVKKAKRLLDGGNFDGLISVSYPFTGHIAGLAIKKRFPHLRWVVDVGDPFCFAEATPQNNPKLYRGINTWAEQKVFSRADRVAVTNHAVARIYGNLFTESASKIRVVPPIFTPFPRQDPDGTRFPKDDKIRLVFVGTLYKEIRSPEYPLHLFAELLKSNLGDQLQLHFLGNVNDCAEFFEPYKHWMGSRIFTYGVVPRERATQVMNACEVLVNIGNKTSYHLPSKLVEYGTTGKPILNFVYSDEDSSIKFFADYPAPIMNLTLWEEGGGADVRKVLDFIQSQLRGARQTDLERWISPFKVEAVARLYERLLEAP
ncbi:MAG: glycosyltransferase [Planctomycetota bacterium]|jgi:hypothetical protein